MSGEVTTPEVQEHWAMRWPDGTVSGALYSSDGSDAAEKQVRCLALDDSIEIVHRTVTIFRTPWATAALAHPSTDPDG